MRSNLNRAVEKQQLKQKEHLDEGQEKFGGFKAGFAHARLHQSMTSTWFVSCYSFRHEFLKLVNNS